MVRRLFLALTVFAVMAGALVAGPAINVQGVKAGAEVAEAAQPGAPDYCGPWQRSWYISPGGWWYFYWWRWCHNPSIQGGWYVDWAGWNWWGPAPPFYGPGYQYSGGPPS